MRQPPARTRLTRRGLLVGLTLAAGTAAAGVRALGSIVREQPAAAGDAGTAPTSTTATPQAPSPAPEPAPTSTGDASPADGAARYEPPGGEVLAEVKRVAGQAVQTLGTARSGDTLGPLDPTLFSPAASPPRMLAASGPLRPASGASTAQIVYAQMAGLKGRTAAVMVVANQQHTAPDGTTSETTRTIDVRLERREPRWLVTGIESAGGTPTQRPASLPAAAQAVLDHPGIHLPDSARWDIHRGDIDPRLLELVAQIAERYAIGVAVLSSGHPFTIFGTDRQSEHTKGRAVDVYAVDNELVVRQRRARTPAYELSRWLFDRGGVNLGSPWAFDGYGGRSFTDHTHQDHLHVAIRDEGE